MRLTLDFETHAIQDRPTYPPKPVGIALKLGDMPAKYMAFGHPTENNCTEAEAREETIRMLQQCTSLVCHNAPFDCAILEEVWGITVPWQIVEDTMVLAFIHNPHGELALKPLAEQLLGMPPEERDAVQEWLIAYGIVPRSSKRWGMYIAVAPGRLVGEYAIGDVERTSQLLDYLLERVDAQEHAAYRREIMLMPHTLHMEQQGVHIDTNALGKDIEYYQLALTKLDQGICEILQCQVDVDSNEQLADAIEAAGKSKGFASTPTGKRSVAKDSLIEAIADEQLLGRLLVRNSLATCLRTFMQPWYEVASKNNGKIYIRWNQVRNYSDTGARTGRISSSPNLQNIPTKWEGLHAQLTRIGYVPEFEMPQVRKYIVPAPGCIFIGRDYAAQELRLLAHFAGGKLLELLQAEPKSDVHMIAASIAGITRKVAKTLGFAVLYGAGVGRIAESLYIAVPEAAMIKEKYLAALPEIQQLQKEVSYRGKTQQCIRTIGGRKYFAETPRVIAGRLHTFEYKLVNYLIQASAADQSKQAMISYASETKHGRLVLTVHDQLVIECPIEHQDEEAKLLEKSMNTSFQDVLDYLIISDEDRGYDFASI